EEKIDHDSVETVDLLVDHPEVLVDVSRLDAFLSGDLFLDQLEMDAHGPQGILDLMRHPRGEGRQGRKTLRPPQARLLGPLLRHVLDMRDAALNAPAANE